jgi:hypothetical protein
MLPQVEKVEEAITPVKVETMDDEPKSRTSLKIKTNQRLLI